MAIDWTEIPNNQKDMYERWIKFSVGNLNAAIRQANKYKDPSVPSDCVYQYDSANNRVYNTINTESLVGIVSPDSRSDHYIFDGQLKTFSTGDNDPIGFVIAYVKMPNGDVHTLTAMRTTFGKPSDSDQYGFWLGAPLTIVKDYLTHAPYRVAEGFGGLKYYNGHIPTADNKFVPAAEHNPATNWMSFAPNGFRIRVTRVRDIITVETSQLNETTLVPGAKITVNLADHPELEIFRARCHYGFCSVSQDRVYWGGTIKHPMLRSPFWLSDVHNNYGTHGWMADAAEAGGIWKRDPVDLKDVFYKWMRVSRGHQSAAGQAAAGYGNSSVPSDMAAFTYDEATNRIGNPLNTGSVVGFVSPDSFDSFILDVTMKSSSNWQCDPTGIMIACTYDPDGTFHTLHAIRSSWGPGKSPGQYAKWAEAPFFVVLDYMTIGHRVIRKAYGGLIYSSGEVSSVDSPNMVWVGDPGTMWHFEDLPGGVRIRLDRNGDELLLSTSQYNSNAIVPGANISINLADYPELERFRKPCSYGFCSISQDNIWWDATIRPGGWRRPFWMSEFEQTPHQIAVTFDASNHNFNPDTDLHPKMLAAAGGTWPTSNDTEWLIQVKDGVQLISAVGVENCFTFVGAIKGTVHIENRGLILGRGGRGGQYRYRMTPDIQAQPGKNAIYREPHVTLDIINHGIIAGGGGGGAGAMGRDGTGNGPGSAHDFTVCGGGGAPLGGTNPYTCCDRGSHAKPGSITTPGGGGTNHCHLNTLHVTGGAGGELGAQGGGVYNSWTNLHGGAPGKAITGSGPIVWTNHGDIRGQIS